MNAVLRPILYLVDEEPERLSLLKQAGERCGEFSEIRAVMDAHLVYQELLDRANSLAARQVLVITHWDRSNLIGLACALRAHPGLEDLPVIATSHSPTGHADALACGCRAFFRRPVGLAGCIALLRKLRRVHCRFPREIRRIDATEKPSYNENAERPAIL